MTNYCVCAGCKNNPSTGHRFHGFPKNKATRQQWVKFVRVRRPGFSVTSITTNTKICSAHFKKGDYDQGDARMVALGLKTERLAKLIPSTVPSVHTQLCTCSEFRINLLGICSCFGKQGVKLDDANPNISVSRTPRIVRPAKGRRSKSLYNLVRSLRWMMESSPEGTLDTKRAAKLLKTNDKRITDATNALQGSGVLVKMAQDTFQQTTKLKTRLDREVHILEDQEKTLDELIKTSLEQIYHMCEDETSEKYLYLTYGDLKTIPSLTQQSVIVIKAPVESVVEMSHPAESHQLFLKSTQAAIEVFFCSEDHSPYDVPYDPHGDEDHMDCCSDVGGMMPPPSFPSASSPGPVDDLYGSTLLAAEHLPPPLATRPVSPSPGPLFSSRVSPSSDGEEEQQSFATLTTPLALSLGGEEYLLSLGEGEGIEDPFSDELEGGLWRCLAPDSRPL